MKQYETKSSHNVKSGSCLGVNLSSRSTSLFAVSISTDGLHRSKHNSKHERACVLIISLWSHLRHAYRSILTYSYPCRKISRCIVLFHCDLANLELEGQVSRGGMKIMKPAINLGSKCFKGQKSYIIDQHRPTFHHDPDLKQKRC